MIDISHRRSDWFRENIWLVPLSVIAILLGLLVLIRLSPVTAAVAAVGICACIGVLRFPWLGFILLVASVPAQQFGAVQVGTATLTATQAVFPIAIGGFLIAIVLQHKPVRTHLAIVPFAALILVQLLSSFDALSGVASITDIGRWSVALAAFVIAIQFLSYGSERVLLTVVAVFALGGVFEATTGITQSVLALGPDSFQVTSGLTRAFGTFGKPNTYAAYLVMVFFPVVFVGLYYLTSIPNRFRAYTEKRFQGFSTSADYRHALLISVGASILLLGAAAITLSGIVASLSRGAWLGFAVGILVTALLWNTLSRILLLIAIPMIGILFLAGQAGIVPDNFSERLSPDSTQFRLFDAASIPITDENFAAVERMAHWQAGWRMFESEPALGVGAGNFNNRYGDYYVREEFRFTRGHAHNYYIHTMAETGLLGLVAYLTLSIGMLILGIRTVLGMEAGLHRAIALGAVGSITAIGIHNLFENLHVLNLGILISTLWALIIAANIYQRTSEQQAKETS